MLIYGFTGDDSGFMEIENKLQPMQKFVGGHIEVISLTEELDLIVNDDYLFNGTEPRLILLENGKFQPCVVMGDCFVCRHNGKGKFVSIKYPDISAIQKRLLHLKCEELKLLARLYLESMTEDFNV